MGSRKEQILEENIVIPDIVQKKAEEAFWTIRKKRTDEMEKMKDTKRGNWMVNGRGKKAALGMCACAALLLVTGVYGFFGTEDKGAVGAPAQTAENDEMLQAVSNLFTLKVYAADASDAAEDGYVNLEKGKEVPISLGGENTGYVLCGMEDGGISYCIDTSFLCEGEGIEYITYSINQGAFQIVEPQDSTIVIEGEHYEGELSTGSSGGEVNETTGEFLSAINHYKSFTVAYDNQNNEQTWINICGNSDNKWEELFDEDNDLEKKVQGIDTLMENVVITCTVQYADGSVGESQITIGGGITKPEGEGVSEKAEPYATFVFKMQ